MKLAEYLETADYNAVATVVYKFVDPLKPGILSTYEPVSPVWRKSNGFLLLGPLATGFRTSFCSVE